ncbi:peptide-methionine (S)-S-oxide reductase [Pontibacter sp. E15-1]|nr:peptide-methionine (S)-S-oxide reductase [Pontibacter sp. E15-1]
MGCFWGVEAFFGSIEGVVRTRAGYTGGTKLNPTYHTLGEHMEAVQLDFDPSQITFSQLLQRFYHQHIAARPPYKRQYSSAVFYHTPAQLRATQDFAAQHTQQAADWRYTLVMPASAFYLAEDRHQKYRLQRHKALFDAFWQMYRGWEGILHSTAAARVNGYLAGYGSREQLEKEIILLGLSPEARQMLCHHVASVQKATSP